MAEAAHQRNAVVSSESEELILVDADDNPIGYLDKARCHDGDGLLHRAFSLFIFDTDGRLLLQQRAPGKRLWGGYWSNSCCSHPRRSETMEVAIRRRQLQELGLECSLQFLYKFRYQAHFADIGSEHELCWVYAGRSRHDPNVNRNEVSAWRWISANDLNRELIQQPDTFTPWFKLEWARLQAEYWDTILRL